MHEYSSENYKNSSKTNNIMGILIAIFSIIISIGSVQMNKITSYLSQGKYLSIFLWLVAIHSFFVGVGLIVLPDSFLDFFGYNECTERFFPSQGGVFHIAMAVGYAMAAYNLKRYECLIIFSIVVKFMATMFLVIYFFFVSSIWLVIFSGATDFLMGLIILTLYRFTMRAGDL